MKNNIKDDLGQYLPPYVSFKTFMNLVSKLKETAVTARIDRSMLQDYSGGVAGALISTFKYLKLIDDNTNTLPPLRALVDAYGTDKWKDALIGIIEGAYTGVIDDLDVGSATRAMLEEKFRQTGAEGEVLSKCINFYLNAIQEADIPLSLPLKQRPRGRREPTRKKASKSSLKKSKDMQGPTIEGTIRFNIPILPDKPSVTIYVPKNISKEEWGIVNNTMLNYISLVEGKKEKA